MAFNEYELELERLKRRRAVAEALRNQAMQPMDQNRMVGNVAIPINPLEGFSKMLQMYLAGQNVRGTEKEEKELGERYRTESEQAMNRIMAAARGDVGPIDPNSMPQAPGAEYGMEGFEIPQRTGKQDRKLAVLEALGGHPDPSMRSIGPKLMLEQLFKGTDIKSGPHYDQQGRAYVLTTEGTVQYLPDIKEREKIVSRDLGGSLGLGTEYSTDILKELPKTITPDASANLGQRQFEWGNISPYQGAQLGVDRARLGLEGQRVGIDRANLLYNTGMEPMGGGAGVPGFVPPAPQMPQLPPGAQPTVPPVQGANIDAMLAAQGHPPEHIAAIKQVMAADQQGKPMSVTVDPAQGQQPFVPPQIPRMTTSQFQNYGAPNQPQGAPQIPLGMPPKVFYEQQAKLMKEKPESRHQTIEAVNYMDRVINSAEKLKTHPGLAAATGGTFWTGLIPGTQAAGATADIKSLATQVFTAALQAMRKASETGGAVGQVAIQEMRALENSFASLDRMQSDEQFYERLSDVQKIARDAMERLKQAYRVQFGEELGYQSPFEKPAGASGAPGVQNAGSIEQDAEAIMRRGRGNR